MREGLWPRAQDEARHRARRVARVLREAWRGESTRHDVGHSMIDQRHFLAEARGLDRQSYAHTSATASLGAPASFSRRPQNARSLSSSRRVFSWPPHRRLERSLPASHHYQHVEIVQIEARLQEDVFGRPAPRAGFHRRPRVDVHPKAVNHAQERVSEFVVSLLEFEARGEERRAVAEAFAS